MRIRNKREGFLILLAIVVAIIAVWLSLPSSTSAATSKMIPLKEAQDKTFAARRAVSKMENDSKEIGGRVEKLVYKESAEELTPQIIEQIQKIADKSGVHIREIKPLKAKIVADGTGTRVPLEVRFRSDLQPNVVQFLYEIEDPSGKMSVEKINITSADSKFKVVEVTAQITVFTKSVVGVSGGDSGEVGDAKINHG